MVFQASLVHRGSPNDSGTSIDGAGVYTELTKHCVIRQRRWATRARTGCLTCRSRHIKCDEGKPSCHQCTKSRRHCRGFSFGRPSYSSVVSGISAQDSVKTDQAILNVPIEEAVAQIPQYFEPEPPHWEQMEAIRYYRHYVLPLRRSRVMKNRHDYPSWAGLHDCYLLMQVATHQIATLYRVHGRLITAKNDPSMTGAWATLSRHMAQLIASVNTDLSNPTNFAHGKLEVFRKIFYLVYFDLAVNASTLGQHLRGFLALVEHIGGVQALIGQDDPQLNAIQRMMILVGVGTNTTTPANKQIRGFEAYTDKNLIKLTSSLLGNQEFYNPAPLWIAGIRLTQLRSQVADGTCTGFSLKLAVEDLFNDISTFNAEEWAYSGKFGVGSLASSFARIFQVATILYGILSLPSSAIISWSLTKTYPRLPKMTAYDCVLISHQRKLLELLYLCRGTFASSNDLNWPLVVAGVSLASYGSVEDRNFIEESLLATWSNPLAMCSPLLCLEKLRIFWASGKRAWDDCFDELTPSIA